MRLESLFFSFPREVGNPERSVVYSKSELLRFVKMNNGINPVFVSLYDHTKTVDKIWFDIDSKNIREAFNEVKKLIERIKDLNLTYIPVFSGRKGFHVYVVCKPMKINGSQLKSIQEYIADGVNADTHGFGDLSRLVRYPNTLNINYATPLPQDFTDWSLDEIILWSKSPKYIDYKIKIHDLSSFVENTEVSPAKFGVVDEKILPIRPEDFVRPCVIEACHQPEPPHIVRFAFVSELMWWGFNEASIYNCIIENFNWSDFDEIVTRQQISNIFLHKYFPPTCESLKSHVRCNKCGWKFPKLFFAEAELWEGYRR